VKLAATLGGTGAKLGLVNFPANLTLHVTDANGKPFDSDTQWLQLSVETQLDKVATTVAPLKKGTEVGVYHGSYTPSKTGKHVISGSAFGVPLFNPVVVPVSVGPSAEKTEIVVTKVGHAGEPIVAKLIPKDANGKPVNAPGAPFSVQVTDPDGNSVTVPLTENSDGTLSAAWTPNSTGDHIYEVKLGDQDIQDGPFIIEVEEDALPESSELDFTPVVQCALRVRALNHKGEPRTKGGDNVKVDVSGDEKPLSVAVDDNSDGTYTVKWEAYPGTYKVSAKIRGRHVKGSPFKYVVPDIKMEDHV